MRACLAVQTAPQEVQQTSAQGPPNNCLKRTRYVGRPAGSLLREPLKHRVRRGWEPFHSGKGPYPMHGRADLEDQPDRALSSTLWVLLGASLITGRPDLRHRCLDDSF